MENHGRSLLAFVALNETEHSRSFSPSPWLVVRFDANEAPPPIFCSAGIKGDGRNGCIKHNKLASGQLQASLVVGRPGHYCPRLFARYEVNQLKR
jgi:hypothetical protein